MLRPPSRSRSLWTLGLVITALAGCATGRPADPGDDGRVDGPTPDAAKIVPADAKVDAEPPEDEPDAKVDAEPEEEPDACIPACSGRVCGDDSCGGSCGSCDGTQTCGADGQCKVPTSDCEAAAWATGNNYAVGAIVTADCQVIVGSTPCNQLGARFAWRCSDAGWCSRLRPGGMDNGWWSAWAVVGSRCN